MRDVETALRFTQYATKASFRASDVRLVSVQIRAEDWSAWRPRNPRRRTRPTREYRSQFRVLRCSVADPR